MDFWQIRFFNMWLLRFNSSMTYSFVFCYTRQKADFMSTLLDAQNVQTFLGFPHVLRNHTCVFLFLFNSMYKTVKCCIYTSNCSFILTFAKLWEAEITGLARSQTFPGVQGLWSKDSVLSKMEGKKKTLFVLFLHLQDRLGWLFRTALLHLMNACTNECMKCENAFWNQNSSVKINYNASKIIFTSRVCDIFIADRFLIRASALCNIMHVQL